MPLSLRRPKRQPGPLLTPDRPSRSVSTPTLLSRLKNSTFSRSKISLSSIAYDSVRARTPPTPYQVKTPLRSPQVQDEKKRDVWRMKGFKLTKEQRECLAGAECLGIWDPVTGQKESPALSDSPTVIMTEFLEDISEIGSDEDTEISTSTPTPESSIHISHFLPAERTPKPTKLKDIFTPPSPPTRARPSTAPFTPYRKITLRSRVRQAKINSTSGSPVMVPLRPESPDPGPHTPAKNDESSPEWTPISVPQTPLNKMKLGDYQ